MAEIEFDEWMSENDAVLWHIERDPQLRSTITALMILDQPPEQDRFDEILSRAVHAIPRLRQRVVSDDRGIAPPRWEIDPLFEPEYHIRHGRVGGEGTLRDLLETLEPIAMQAFDKDRPLWELHQLDGLADGKAGLVLKVHHAISDGVGLVDMTAALVEFERDPGELPPRPPAELGEPVQRSSEGEHQRRAIRHQAETGIRRGLGAAAALGRGAAKMMRDPIGTSRTIADTTTSIARTVRPVSEPLSPIMRDRSLGVCFNELRVEVDQLKAAAKACDGKLNDAFVAGVLGGMDRYHHHHGAPVEELRMTMPINIRTEDDKGVAGNAFAPARFTVPVGITDPAERVAAVAELVKKERAEPAYPLTGQIAAGLFALGPAVFTRLTGSMLKSIDFVTSNVPGPPFPMYSAGALIERNIPFAPLGGAGANITLLSYNGFADVGINTDPAAVPDGDVFQQCLHDGIAEVLALA